MVPGGILTDQHVERMYHPVSKKTSDRVCLPEETVDLGGESPEPLGKTVVRHCKRQCCYKLLTLDTHTSPVSATTPYTAGGVVRPSQSSSLSDRQTDMLVHHTAAGLILTLKFFFLYDSLRISGHGNWLMRVLPR